MKVVFAQLSAVIAGGDRDHAGLTGALDTALTPFGSSLATSPRPRSVGQYASLVDATSFL
jgi:hypothetical protein